MYKENYCEVLCVEISKLEGKMKKYLLFCVCLTATAFADGAPVPVTYKHTLSPVVQLNEHKFKATGGTRTWIGLEYNFIQTQGYNLKITSTSSNSTKYDRSSHFSIANSYKINCYDGSVLYPILGIELKNTLRHNIFYNGDSGEEKIRVFTGIGVQRTFNNWLTLSPELIVSQDVVNKFVQKLKGQKAYDKQRITRDSWYSVSLGLRANMTDRVSFEMTPYYAGTFERDHFERGVKTSMAFAF